jgi:hypothetical protein
VYDVDELTQYYLAITSFAQFNTFIRLIALTNCEAYWLKRMQQMPKNDIVTRDANFLRYNM